MIRRLILALLGAGFILAAALVAFAWFACRIYVPENMCCVLIRKTGEELPPGQKVALKPGQKGIQPEVLGPGRYFRNPYSWEWELKELTVVPAGDPKTWEWKHTLSKSRNGLMRAGTYQFRGDFPRIGVVTRKIGTKPPDGGLIVSRESGHEGIWEEVLTPGTYKLNPYVYDVELHPAVFIPAGFVGVVTNRFGEQAADVLAPDTRPSEGGDEAATQPAAGPATVGPLADPGERGTLRDVLQPGVYFINPKLQKVTPIEIGFNEYSQLKLSESENLRISFPSDTGYLIRVGVTVVWGIDPEHAAEIINEFGNVDRVLKNIIEPQLRSICRNIGSQFSARDFIQGEKREMFQTRMTDELHRVCAEKDIEVLLALVREIEVHAPAGSAQEGEVTDELKQTIQQSYIAIESQKTKTKQTEAATVQAELEQVKKEIDIARETIAADTRIKVASIQADAEKKAAEIDAQTALQVASIQEEVAKLDAQRTEILGQANADVEKFSAAAEAEGYRMLVEAFGSPQAYNLYTFAENFEPESIRLFFAGEGTFWTDLSRFEEAGAAEMLRSKGAPQAASQK